MSTLLLSAGDASGDLHAADFVRAFRKRHPTTRFVGLGGNAMRDAGVEIVADQRDLAVGGLFELAGSAARIFRAWRKLTNALRDIRPDLVVLIDSSGFNLPLARRIRRSGLSAPILYYVAPQVWAWRRGRIRKLARRVDRLAVIFPFEPDVYAETGLRVDYVGHPLVDTLAAEAAPSTALARERCGIDAAGPVVTLLPGSRRNEIAAQLDVQLDAARAMFEREPALCFVLALAPSLAAGEIEARCTARLPEGFPLKILAGHTHDAIRAADVVLAKPGTVTLEAALLERPMVVMGRAHPLTAWILRRVLQIDWLAMPNLIAGKAIVPELLQREAAPAALAREVLALLEGSARADQLERLAAVRQALGEGGAVERACGIAEEMLGYGVGSGHGQVPEGVRGEELATARS